MTKVRKYTLDSCTSASLVVAEVCGFKHGGSVVAHLAICKAEILLLKGLPQWPWWLSLGFGGQESCRDFLIRSGFCSQTFRTSGLACVSHSSPSDLVSVHLPVLF